MWYKKSEPTKDPKNVVFFSVCFARLVLNTRFRRYDCCTPRGTLWKKKMKSVKKTEMVLQHCARQRMMRLLLKWLISLKSVASEVTKQSARGTKERLDWWKITNKYENPHLAPLSTMAIAACRRAPLLATAVLGIAFFREAIVVRTYDVHKNPYIPLRLRTILGPDYCVPPKIVGVG